MAYVIMEPCITTKDTSCVNVCPVDCIHPRKDESDFEKESMLYIDPEVCIDCGACEPACPVNAIAPRDLVPEKWVSYIQRAEAYYKSPERLEAQRLWLEQYEAAQRQLAEERARDPKWQRKVALEAKIAGFSSTLPRDYWYLNEVEIDSLYSQVMGRLVIQEKHQKQKARTKGSSMKATLGNVLALLGIGSLGADLTAASSAQEAEEITSVLSTANKLNIVYEFFRAQDEIDIIDTTTEAKQPAISRHAQYITGDFQLCDFNGSPLPTEEERREFLKSRSYVGVVDADGLFDVMKRGASFVMHIGRRKLIVPFFFSGIRFSGRGGMFRIYEFVRDNKAFHLSIVGLLTSNDTQRVVVSPIAMWSAELRRLGWYW